MAEPVVVQIEPAPPSEENIGSLGELTLLFFLAAIPIICIKALIKLFSTDSHND